MAKSKSHKYKSNKYNSNKSRPKNYNSNNIQNDAQPVQPVHQMTDVSGGAPKKSMILRILVLVVAALMFIGAIIFPFMSLFRS